MVQEVLNVGRRLVGNHAFVGRSPKKNFRRRLDAAEAVGLSVVASCCILQVPFLGVVVVVKGKLCYSCNMQLVICGLEFLL